MNQTWENGKKTNFASGFSQFWPKVGPPKKFYWVLRKKNFRKFFL